MISEVENARRIIADERPFDEWFMNAMNNAATVLLLSIGHRTGLFDTMAEGDWMTADELAERAALQPRYIREWLAGLTTARIIEIDDRSRYRLPEEHAKFLRRDEKGVSMAAMTQFFGVLGSVEEDVVKSFREGGGVPYSAFKGFHAFMAEDSYASVVAALQDSILPLIPGLSKQLEAGIRVLDVGCGRGLAMISLAEMYPESRFEGFDLSEEAIEWASDEAARRCLTNVSFTVRDASVFDRTAEPEAYDVVTTFDAVHDQAKPLAVLKGIGRTLKPGGIYLMQDIHAHSDVQDNLDHPAAPLLYTISCMHCMTVSLAQGGDGLGTMWGQETALKYLEDAGFTDVEI